MKKKSPYKSKIAKCAYGGQPYQNPSKAAVSNTVQSAAEAVPVYGQFAALGKMASETGADIFGRDTRMGQAIINGRPDQAIGQLFTDFKEGNYGSAAANLLTLGGSEFFKPLLGFDNDPATKDKLSLGNPFERPKMPLGGPVSDPNVELEKEENTLNPDGSTTQFDGPSHEQGGIPTKLDPKTLVFSDRLKIGKKTIAELNEPFNTDKEEKILNNPKKDSRARLTAELMKMAKNKQSIELYKQQESIKAEKVAKYAEKMGYKMSNGGQVPKYGVGGPFDPNSEGFLEPSGSSSGVPSQWTSEDQALMDGFTNTLGNSLANRQSSGDTMDSSGGSNVPWGQIAQVGLSLAQNMGNFYDLKRSKDIENRQYSRITPELLNDKQAISDNNMVFRAAVNDAKNSSVGNSSVFLNNRRALAAERMRANARIRADYANQNAQIKNNTNMYNNELINKATVDNANIRANARNIRGQAISNIGSNIYNQGSGMMRDQAAQNRDREYLMMIAKTYPQVLSDPSIKDYYDKNVIGK